MKKLLLFFLLLILVLVFVGYFAIGDAIAALILLLLIFFSYKYYQMMSYKYRNKPVRRFFVFLFAILLSPIIIPMFAIGWVFDVEGIQSMYVDGKPIEFGDDDGGYDEPYYLD